MKKLIRLIYLSVFVWLTSSISLAQPVGIMTYNIRLDLTQDAENRWDNRKEAVIDLLTHYQPGIIGIQEGLMHQVNYMDSCLNNYSFIGVGRDDGKTKGEYCAIYYDTTQYSVLAESTFWLSEKNDSVSMGWDAAYMRICTYGLFISKSSQEKFWVFNTHFDNKGEVAREKSASLIVQKIEALNTDDLPLILMGDFNSLPKSEPIRILNTKLNDAQRLSERIPYGPIGTYTGFDPLRTITNRIDYIFVKKLKVLSYVHIDDRRKDNHFISDHLPVMTTLDF